MNRGELYLYRKPPGNDPKKQRVFVVVGRQSLLNRPFSTAICAPVYSRYEHMHTQLPVGVEEGLKHDSAIYCDELTSLERSRLTHYIGRLSPQKMQELDRALAIALDLPEEDELDL